MPAGRRVWRDGIYAIIEAMTSPMRQGELTVDRMCALAGVSRAGYYRHWSASAPRQEETAVRDAVQRAALANRRYGSATKITN
jgi:putative transposase